MADNSTVAFISAASALVGALVGGSFSVIIEFVRASIHRKDRAADRDLEQVLGYRQAVKDLVIEFLQLTDPELMAGAYDMHRISRIIAELQIEFNLNDAVERDLNQCLNKMYLIANNKESQMPGEHLRVHSDLMESAKKYIHTRRAQEAARMDSLSRATQL